jgi:DNA modification methylase
MEIKATSIVMVPINKIIPNDKNNNIHTEEQKRYARKIFDYQGFRAPLLISNRTGKLVAGHLRLEIAKEKGVKELPCMFQDFDSEEQEYAHLTADNALAAQSSLDFGQINTDILELGPFDIELLGIKDFVIEPIEKLEPQCDEDEVPEVVHPITRKGDLWLLGKHRLLCGDSAMIDDVEKLMNGQKVELLLTDPPYLQNIGIATNAEDRLKKRTKKMLSSNLNDFNPEYFLSVVSVLDIDSVYIFHSKDLISRYIQFMETFDRKWELLAMTKTNLMPFRKGHFLNDIEWIIFSKKTGSYFNESLDNSFYSKFRPAKQVNSKDYYHPTRKDVSYLVPFIEISSKSTVLDLFLGSGSTLIACEKTARKCYGMELDEKYCDVIIKRWEQYTGKKATLELTGQTYEELKLERDNQSLKS